MADKFDTHGDFSWCELLTKDVEASKKFYKELIGWTMENVPMENSSYTILKANGQSVGGIMKMPPKAQDVTKCPPPPTYPAYWKMQNSSF